MQHIIKGIAYCIIGRFVDALALPGIGLKRDLHRTRRNIFEQDIARRVGEAFAFAVAGAYALAKRALTIMLLKSKCEHTADYSLGCLSAS